MRIMILIFAINCKGKIILEIKFSYYLWKKKNYQESVYFSLSIFYYLLFLLFIFIVYNMIFEDLKNALHIYNKN